MYVYLYIYIYTLIHTHTLHLSSNITTHFVFRLNIVKVNVSVLQRTIYHLSFTPKFHAAKTLVN